MEPTIVELPKSDEELFRNLPDCKVGDRVTVTGKVVADDDESLSIELESADYAEEEAEPEERMPTVKKSRMLSQSRANDYVMRQRRKKMGMMEEE